MATLASAAILGVCRLRRLRHLHHPLHHHLPPFDVGDTSDISIEIDVEIETEGGYDIGLPDKGCFLDRQRLFKTLRSHADMIRQIPDGHKNNKHFIINNTENLKGRQIIRESGFVTTVGLGSVVRPT